MSTLTRWAARVHAECLATGRSITAHEAIELFGNVPSSRGASTTLNFAADEGWFRRTEVVEMVGLDRIKRQRYVAIDKAPVDRAKPVVERASYFDGLRRVSSVFELGDAP